MSFPQRLALTTIATGTVISGLSAPSSYADPTPVDYGGYVIKTSTPTSGTVRIEAQRRADELHKDSSLLPDYQPEPSDKTSPHHIEPPPLPRVYYDDHNTWVIMPPLTPSAAPTNTEPDDNTLRTLAAQAILQTNLPTPTINIEPNPKNNRWNKLAVNLPIWLSLTNPTTHHATVTIDDITITLDAHAKLTRFDMGDGSGIDCTHTNTTRPANTDPWKKSPTCGYTYTTTGTYTITATTMWEITWTANNHHGQLATTTTNTTELPITQLTSKIIG